MIPDSYRSNFRPFYLQPPYAFLSFCSLLLPGIGRGIVAPPLRDGFRSWLRHRKGGLANASGRIEFNIVVFMDWSFASGCSPPRLSTTQLPSATDRPVFLSGKDFHPSVWCVFSGAPFLALRALQFGHFQDFFRVNKSLFSAKAERDLGSWPRPERVPEGHMTVARRFIAGSGSTSGPCPGGTPEYRRSCSSRGSSCDKLNRFHPRNFDRPSGTRANSQKSVPAINRRPTF